MPVSTRAVPVLSRRGALTLPAVVGGLGALAACSGSPTSDPTDADDATSSGTAASTPAAQATTSLQRVTDVLEGNTLDVEVGPLVRVDESSSILLIHVERPEDDPNQDTYCSPGVTWVGNYLDEDYGTQPLRIVDPEGSRVWLSTHTDYSSDSIKPGESVDLQIVCGAVDAEVSTVTVLLATTGFFQVSVVDLDTVPDLDAQAILAEAKPNAELAAPIALERYTEAVDGSGTGLTTAKDVTVTISGDVTFEVDSSDLTLDADALLGDTADTIAEYPDGGTLTITGHTDDVNDDDYNQGLSERRAQAVSDRLGELTDLSAWEVAVSGKGEKEPREQGTDDAARAANRRVEIVITPTGGTAGTLNAPAATASVPKPEGPSAPGPDGVTIPDPDGEGSDLTITLERVTRRGGLLLGELVLTGGEGETGVSAEQALTDGSGWGLNNARGESGGLSSASAASGVTLLSGGSYVFPVDYLPPDRESHRPLAELSLTGSLNAGQVMRVCIAWPDTGEDTVIVDRPADTEVNPLPWRLTDVPVVEG
ncbi:OmpA family protein [Actinomyces qiguomingii]|uniref:OmpA family protein n=1 Tax=Actinomyces qiguomingii TaxID=2057800 RepID=UPI00130504AB|nr:OmpA family protein [Actinomyces qiguomingii]